MSFLVCGKLSNSTRAAAAKVVLDTPIGLAQTADPLPPQKFVAPVLAGIAFTGDSPLRCERIQCGRSNQIARRKDAMARAQNSMPSDSFKLTEEAGPNKVKDNAPQQVARPALPEARPDH